jgi:DNA-binding transcriptional MerR regulator
VTPKLFKAADVCELAKLQPYVLRSWEKEFPGIGVQKSADSPRLYRQSDVDQILTIKQLIIGEGLTVSGARKRLEQSAPASASVARAEMNEVLDVLGSDVRTKIATVRDGLKQLQSLLSKGLGEFELAPPSAKAGRKVAAAPARRAPARSKASAPKRVAKKTAKRRASA